MLYFADVAVLQHQLRSDASHAKFLKIQIWVLHAKFVLDMFAKVS